MPTRFVNDGKNRLIEELVDGGSTIEELAVGDDGSTASTSDTELGNELARYDSTNRRRATGNGRFEATIPEQDPAVDDETLREIGGFIDVAGADDLAFRIDFAETPKSEGSRIELEVDVTLTNV